MSWKRKCRVSSRQKRSRLKRLSSTREWRTLALPSSNKTFAAKLRNCWGRALLSLALLLPILLSGAPVVAQRGHRPPSIDDRVKVLAKKRSEEHTSELQSRLHLVCRLLLEKKKQPIMSCVTFMSPPPHHDKYSIYDLTQLIHQPKHVNPPTRLALQSVP